MRAWEAWALVSVSSHCCTASGRTPSQGTSPHVGATCSRQEESCVARVCGESSPSSHMRCRIGLYQRRHTSPTVGHGASWPWSSLSSARRS